MIQNNPLPVAPADQFSNVSLITDPTTTPGVVMIRGDHFLRFVQNDFDSQALATTISQYVQTGCRGSSQPPRNWQQQHCNPLHGEQPAVSKLRDAAAEFFGREPHDDVQL